MARLHSGNAGGADLLLGQGKPLAPADPTACDRVHQAGDIDRTVLAGKNLRVPATALLATVVIERVFDFLSMLLIVVVILVMAGHVAPEIRVACWTVGVSHPVAIAASLIYNLLTIVPALILGLSGLRRAGMILHRHLVS